VQAVSDGVFVVVDEGQEPAYFGEGEGDEAPVEGWSGFRFVRVVALV
jgi:hypothetical protein